MRNRRISSLLVFAAGLGFAALSQAQEKVVIQPTHFGPNVQVTDAVKRECELEAKLVFGAAPPLARAAAPAAPAAPKGSAPRPNVRPVAPQTTRLAGASLDVVMQGEPRWWRGVLCLSRR